MNWGRTQKNRIPAAICTYGPALSLPGTHPAQFSQMWHLRPKQAHSITHTSGSPASDTHIKSVCSHYFDPPKKKPIKQHYFTMRSQSTVTVILMKRVHTVANISVSLYAVNCRKPVSRRTKSTRCWSSVTWRCSSQRALHAGTIGRWFCVIRWDHQPDREGHRCDKMVILWTFFFHAHQWVDLVSVCGTPVPWWHMQSLVTRWLRCDTDGMWWHLSISITPGSFDQEIVMS